MGSVRSLTITVSVLLCTRTFVEMAAITMDTGPSEPSSKNATFMYFAYGSNLLAKRILIQNPTAKRRAIGKLEGYRLDFNVQTRSWNGCSATIVREDDSNVWGAIWEIDMSNMKDLDRQEGVDINAYKALWKSIETPTGEKIICRLYEKVLVPEVVYPLEKLPINRQPSKTYLDCIVKGAVESRLPVEYIRDLTRIRHNRRNSPNPAFRKVCEYDNIIGYDPPQNQRWANRKTTS